MKVKVQTNWHGHRIFSFTLHIKGRRKILLYPKLEDTRAREGGEWTRSTATEALDVITKLMPQVRRKNIRFHHR